MGSCTSHPKAADEEIKMRQLAAVTLDTADEVVYRFTKAKVLKVYDGDTITIAAHYAGQIVKFSVRIFGVDCDEMKGGTEQTRYNARLAKKYVEAMILDKIVDVEILNNRIHGGKRIREKFGRLLAIVKVDGNDLANMLLEAGLARKYDGGHKDDTPLYPRLDYSIHDGSLTKLSEIDVSTY